MDILQDQDSNKELVTVIVSRKVKQGREQEFEAWRLGIEQEASKFEGHLGTQLIRPSNHISSEYVVIFKFDNYSNLKKWEESTGRARWIEKTGDFTEGSAHIHKLTGLEYWFALPKEPLQAPPPRYKMAIATFLALFPTINLVNLTINPLLDGLHEIIRLAITVMITVALMTYLIMPLMIRLLAFWLYKNLQNE